jgi:hypothetical protein
VEKPWGHEVWWAQTDAYAGKLLYVEAGHQLSLQLHRQKDEARTRLQRTVSEPVECRRFPICFRGACS